MPRRTSPRIRDPERLLPAALALGHRAVVVLYLALNLLYVYSSRRGTGWLMGSVMDVIAARLFGPRAGDLLAALTAVSIAASVSAIDDRGSARYFAMARDGAFSGGPRDHPRYRTPAAATAPRPSGARSCPDGSFEQLITYTALRRAVLRTAAWRCSCFGAKPRESRPVDAWGYPVMPALFVIASALIVATRSCVSRATAAGS